MLSLPSCHRSTARAVLLVIFFFHSFRYLRPWTELVKTNELPVGLAATTTSLPTEAQLDQQSYNVSKKFSSQPVTMDPMWSCLRTRIPSERQKKLIFIHVFKTAGSSLRKLFLVYGKVCETGVSVLQRCSEWKLPKGHFDAWDDGGKKKCQLQFHQWRTNNTSKQILQNTVINSRFLQREVDLLVGHFPLGVHHAWSFGGNHSKEEDYQYVTFFRDPIHKLVSGFVYSQRQHGNHLAFDDAVTEIKKYVTNERKKGKTMQGYSSYLLSPDQKKIPARRRAQQIKENLVEHRFVVGIVERITESMALLQYLLDGTRVLSGLFSVVSTDHGGKKSLLENKSHLSSSALVQTLLSDAPFAKILDEYVRDDTDLYNFALDIHRQQYNSIE